MSLLRARVAAAASRASTFEDSSRTRGAERKVADWSCSGRAGMVLVVETLFCRTSGMTRVRLIHDRLSYSVIGAFFEAYHTLGFGFLEHVYVASLTRELHHRGHEIGREVSVPILY